MEEYASVDKEGDIFPRDNIQVIKLPLKVIHLTTKVWGTMN